MKAGLKLKYTPAREPHCRKPNETEAKRVVDVSGRPFTTDYSASTHVSLPREPFPLEEIRE